MCLRLPDVIGPYDSTCRFWAYVMWISDMKKKPIHTQPDSRNDKLSFVFSEDVSDLCVNMLSKVNDPEFIKKVHNQSYNIAFEENPTLDEFVTLIVSILKYLNQILTFLRPMFRTSHKSNGKTRNCSMDMGSISTQV